MKLGTDWLVESSWGEGYAALPPQTPPHLLVMRGSAPQTPRGLDFRILHLSTSPDWLIWSLTG